MSITIRDSRALGERAAEHKAGAYVQAISLRVLMLLLSI